MMDYLTPQPSPKEGKAAPTWHAVCAELLSRALESEGQEAQGWKVVALEASARNYDGARKYGVQHQFDNGRDHAVDAYQEALDGVCYWRAEADVAHLLGDESRATEAWALYQDSLSLAHRARLYLLRRDGK